MTRPPLRAGELALADQLYFLTHDRNGNRRLHERAIGYGLAASLIAELAWSGWALIEPDPTPFTDGRGILTLLDQRPIMRADPNAHSGAATAALPPLWHDLATEPWRHPLRTWLDYAGQGIALGAVEARLVHAGHLRQERKRHVAVQISTANAPEARMWGVLQRMVQPSGQDLTLLALADAVGLRSLLLNTHQPAASVCMDTYLAGMKDENTMWPIVELAAQTGAAVGASVLTRT